MSQSKVTVAEPSQAIPETQARRRSSNLNDPEWAQNLVHILERLSDQLKNKSVDTISDTEVADDEINDKPFAFEPSKPSKSSLKHSETPIRDQRRLTIPPEKKQDFASSVRKTAESVHHIPTKVIKKIREIQLNSSTKQQLLTQSHYQGVWRDALQCMDGYGTYTYPDGSIYRGYFSRGQFNGYGTLHLAEPYNYTYKGTFIDGLIHEIDDMWFDDGLHVNATFDGWTGDFSKWKYCSQKDRRYAKEHVEGLPAVGPYSYLTGERPPKELGNFYYDLGDGVFNPRNGMVINRSKPFPNLHVPCKDEVEWIKKNCRHGEGIKKSTTASACDRIIKNNLENELELEEHEPSCNFNANLNCKKYFEKFCQDGPQKKASQETVNCRQMDSSSSLSSFSDLTLVTDIQEHLESSRQYEKLDRGRDLEKDESTLMSEPQPKL